MHFEHGQVHSYVHRLIPSHASRGDLNIDRLGWVGAGVGELVWGGRAFVQNIVHYSDSLLREQLGCSCVLPAVMVAGQWSLASWCFVLIGSWRLGSMHVAA